MRSLSRQLALQRLTLISIVILTVLALFAPNIQIQQAYAATGDFTPTSGTDTTSGAAVALTSGDLTNLNSSNDVRQVSDGNWSMTGAYSSTLYIEYVFSPSLAVTNTINSVVITHEFRRSAALDAANLQVFETDTGTWHDESITLPSAANTDFSQDIDVSSYINSVTDVNGLKIRFTAYRSSVVASNTTSHDYLNAHVIYNAATTNTSTSTLTRTSTATSTLTHTSTSTSTQTRTNTPTQTRTNTPTSTTSFAARSVVINEVAWMGTTASTSDEWIELFNTTGAAINLNNWTVTIDSGTPITLTGSIPANGFYLMERTAETTTNVASDFIYTGGLNNTGGTLTLRDPSNTVIDTANGDGGAWPAGDSVSKSTMERINPTSVETDSNWVTNNGTTINGLDAGSNPIKGTPKQANSSLSPTATQTNTLTPSRTSSPTLTRTPTLTATSFPARAVIINELTV